MANYNLTTIRPKGFLHSSAFAEVKDSLAWALTALGHFVNLTENAFSSGAATNIIFGCELLDVNTQLPSNSIIYNFEQPSHPNMANIRTLAWRAKCKIWEYSARPRMLYEGLDVTHVPVGYTPNLTRIPKASTQDIDVCFLGWMTPRRRKIVQDLIAAGLKVYASDQCYGGARDNILSRSKVVLNVHHDGRDMFEIVRVSYLLANSKAVISEESSDDSDYQELPLVRVKYENLVSVCTSHAPAKEHLDTIVDLSSAVMRKRDYVPIVAAALDGHYVAMSVSNIAPTMPRMTDAEKIEARYERGCREGDMRDFLPWLRAHARGNVLEIGVRDGASTSALLLGVEEHGGHVHSIDINDCSGLWKHPKWIFHHGDSKKWNPHGIQFDLILIDGDHSRDGFLIDLHNAYFKWSAPNAIICCHDISPSHTFEELGGDWPSVEVGNEYRFFVRDRNLKHEELPGENGMGVIYK